MERNFLSFRAAMTGDTDYRQRIHDMFKGSGFQMLSDAVLESCDGTAFHVSKLAMTACSDYFKALYMDVLQSGENMHVFRYPDMSRDEMDIIVEFSHGSSIEFITSKHSINDVIAVLDRYCAFKGLKFIEDFLLKKLNQEDAFSVWRISSRFNLPRACEASLRLILYNFKPGMASDGDLTVEELKTLISDDRLNMKREEDTFYCIVKWIDMDRTNREKYLLELVKLVRFGNSAVKFVETSLLSQPRIQAIPALVEYLKNVDQVLKDIQRDPIPAKFDVNRYPFLRPRIPRDLIFTFGGWSSSSAVRIIETYDCRVNKWYEVNGPDTLARAYHGMAYLDGLIYVIGGFDGNKHFSTVDAFDPISQTWTQKGNMTQARCYVSIGVLNGKIYACGRFDGLTRTDSVECYEPATNQWTRVSSMNYHRSDASAAVLYGRLYVLGGFDGNEVLSTVEYYSPELDTWTLIEKMNSPRSGVQAVAHDGYLFVFGGNDGLRRLTSGERYDPERQYWKPIPSMKIPRSNFTSVSLEGCIYIIGGFNGTQTIDNVECFDPSTNLWSDMWPMGVAKRSALSSCVISGLENGKKYSWLRRELIRETKDDVVVEQVMQDEPTTPVAGRTRNRQRARA